MTEMGRKLPVKTRSCTSTPPPPFIPKNMMKWKKAFLPIWIYIMQISAFVWAFKCVKVKYGKSKLKRFMFLHHSWKCFVAGNNQSSAWVCNLLIPSNLWGFNCQLKTL